MASKKAKRRGSSKAGRPRKNAPRYPGGKLKPAGPNARVMENRRALVGDSKISLNMASDPVDLAHAHGWLSDADHLTIARLLHTYRLAGFNPPHMGSGTLHEVQPALNIDTRPYSTMSYEEIHDIWDQVFNVVEASDEPKRQEERNAALGLWRKAMAKMSPAVRKEVFDLCIGRAWPGWILRMTADPTGPREGNPTFQRLMEGLIIARSVLKKPRAVAAEMVVAAAEPRPTIRKVIEEQLFVDEDGRELQMIGRNGVPFSVARKVAR